MKKHPYLVLLATLTMATACTSSQEEADLILTNATIYTVDDAFSTAQAFAVKEGRFLAIGTNDEITKHYKADKVVDAKGQFVYPGFMDGHCHFTGYGESKIRYADLVGCLSFDEVVERLKVHDSLHPSEWLLGRGWDQNRWAVAEFPDNTALEKAFPNRKVLLTRIDGHAVLASKAALATCKLDEKSQIDGGVVMVQDGQCTGILIDNAADIAKRFVPEPDIAQRCAALTEAQDDCFAVGLTNVTDAGLGIDDIKRIDSLQQAGLLSMHVNAMINPDDTTMNHFCKNGPLVKDKLNVRSVKIYADGALGSRGACLLEPYTDAPQTSGLFVSDDSTYRRICQKAYESGFQVCCHAIGDRGVRHLLNIYSEYLKGDNDLRWRMEHSQVVHPDDFVIYKRYSIIPSIQSTHCTSDMGWAAERLGHDRIRTAYAQRQLLEQNGWIINGTDFPIENISPLYTFYAAVARKDLAGNPRDGFQPENALGREDALRSITIWVAKGCFLEQREGSIEVGKTANFVILDTDLLHCRENELPDAKITSTFIDGTMVFGPQPTRSSQD